MTPFGKWVDAWPWTKSLAMAGLFVYLTAHLLTGVLCLVVIVFPGLRPSEADKWIVDAMLKALDVATDSAIWMCGAGALGIVGKRATTNPLIVEAEAKAQATVLKAKGQAAATVAEAGGTSAAQVAAATATPAAALKDLPKDPPKVEGPGVAVVEHELGGAIAGDWERDDDTDDRPHVGIGDEDARQ